MEVVGCVIAIIILIYILCKIYITQQQDKISFRDSVKLTGSPIIILENNGRSFNFLLDTGATRSIINSQDLQNCKYIKNNAAFKNTGIEGEQTVVSSVIMELQYKNRNYKETFLIRDMSKTFEMIKQETGVTINGIIGVTFFTKYKYILDFDELVAYSNKLL